MLTPHVSTTPAIGSPLVSTALVREFGARADVTRKGVRILHEAMVSLSLGAFVPWKHHFSKWGGRAIEKSPKHLAKLAKRYGISLADENMDQLLFAMQTYYALLVNRVADRVLGRHGGDLLPGNLFSWYLTSPPKNVERLIDHITDILSGYRIASASATDDGECDLFKALYQDLFPRALRHALGEYYTPDWLARHVLDQVGYTGRPDQRLLDPSCGSGAFLVMALRRLREGGGGWGARGGENNKCGMLNDKLPVQHIAFNVQRSTFPVPRLLSPAPPLPIVGFDLNPLAVLTARANYLINIADMLPESGNVEIPVYLCDSILGEPELRNTVACGLADAAPFDYVVGNPPWIAWDNLPEEYRQATKPLWERYGLFSLSGNEARHGGGKKDLSMLMLYTAADRYLKPDGRLGMVITQTVFQSKGAGDGFRRFRLGADGLPLRVLRVDDLVAMRPFVDAANWTSTIVLQKGEVTEYPVAYFKWDGERGARDEKAKAEEVASGQWSVVGNPPSADPQSPIPSPSFLTPCLARPIDPTSPNSPWLILERNDDCSILRFRSDYTAHLGANSGGANGVYWMEVLHAARAREKGSGPIYATPPPARSGKLDPPPFLVRVRNIAARGKHPLKTIEQTIEADLLYPLLRWSDVQRWSAVPRGHIVLCQDPTTRSGIAKNVMAERYPRTLEYLGRFRELLAARAAYRRYQGTQPFYSMYNVGPYTVAPIKVVWRRMDRRINAAVVETIDDPQLGRRPIVPQETCVLVACETSDEAHYVCAVLNSAIVGKLVSACSVRGGKGFGTPGILDYIPLCRYQADDPRHVELSVLSRKAHAGRFIDVCTVNEPRPTNGRLENGPNTLIGQFIHQANIHKNVQQEIDRLAAILLRG